MKKLEKQILDTFASGSTAIDPKFKKNLRNQITKKSAKGVKKEGLKWPKLVLVPALALIAAVVIFAGFQRPEQGKNPFRPGSVSAQELITLSDNATTNRDENAYNFWIDSSVLKPGPRKVSCSIPGMDVAYVPDLKQSMYTYINKKAKIEAMFVTVIPDGKTFVTNEVYNDTGADVLRDMRLPHPQSLSSWLRIATMGGKNEDIQISTIHVMRRDKLVQTDTLVPSTVQGRSVYEFYTVPDPEKSDNAGCEPLIHKFVVDANTYQLLENNSYAGRVSQENLTEEATWSYESANLTVDEALARLKDAGYEKNLAIDHVSDKYSRQLNAE